MNKYQAVEALKEKNVKVFLAATGAAPRAQGLLWDVPGASKFLVGSVFPYSTNEFDNFIGYRRKKSYCSQEAALELCMASYIRAHETLLAEKDYVSDALGVGITCTVATSREHKGEHRIFVATCNKYGFNTACIAIPARGGLADAPQRRADDGQVTDLIALNAILASQDIEQIRINYPAFKREELSGHINFFEEDASFTLSLREYVPQLARELFFKRPVYTPYGTKEEFNQVLGNIILLPGTFNPLHEGHQHMANQIGDKTGKQVVYVTTADPMHKPALSVPDMLQRVAMVRQERWECDPPHTIVFTEGDPLFIQKAAKFLGRPFVVGVDTVMNFLDPKWGETIIPMLRKFRTYGTSFYVFDREVNGKLVTLIDLIKNETIPDGYSGIFHEAGKSLNISSTLIRAERNVKVA